jgi:beta-mannanase
MFSKFINALIIIITLATFGFMAFTAIAPFTPHKFVYQGVVDGEGFYDNIGAISIENHFMAWDKNAVEFGKMIDSVFQRKREPLVTIEPWGLVEGEEYNFKNLQGPVYKAAIVDICKTIEQKGKKVILRWGHEMEQVGSRYPWASNDAEGFKSAYKFFVNTCANETKLAEFMWSPAGQANLVNYYPGAEYVDVIGLSTFGYPEYEEKEFGNKLSFEDTFGERYKRVEKYGKDIYLAEFGVAGDQTYQKKWMSQAKKAILDPLKYPNLRGIIYFHGGDAKPWVEGINAPNFRLQPKQFPLVS